MSASLVRRFFLTQKLGGSRTPVSDVSFGPAKFRSDDTFAIVFDANGAALRLLKVEHLTP